MAELVTVKRNSIEARTMWDRAVSARSHTLENYFIGQDVDIPAEHAWYTRVLSWGGHGPRIVRSGDTYTIHYHSNHWVELKVAPGRSRSRASERIASVPGPDQVVRLANGERWQHKFGAMWELLGPVHREIHGEGNFSRHLRLVGGRARRRTAPVHTHAHGGR
jgi:hypothetical protein